MEDATPTFCKGFPSKKAKCNFSKACEKMTGMKPKGKFSCSNDKIFSEKEKTKNKKDHKHKNRHQSQKIKIGEFSDIPELDEEKSHHHKPKNHKENNNHNIHSFMKKNKFKLRNDFDKKHAEQFLLSKEEAFEKPYIFFVEN